MPALGYGASCATARGATSASWRPKPSRTPCQWSARRSHAPPRPRRRRPNRDRHRTRAHARIGNADRQRLPLPSYRGSPRSGRAGALGRTCSRRARRRRRNTDWSWRRSMRSSSSRSSRITRRTPCAPRDSRPPRSPSAIGSDTDSGGRLETPRSSASPFLPGRRPITPRHRRLRATRARRTPPACIRMGRAHADRARRRAPRRRRPHQPASRQQAPGRHRDRQDTPRAHLHEARHQQPSRARRPSHEPRIGQTGVLAVAGESRPDPGRHHAAQRSRATPRMTRRDWSVRSADADPGGSAPGNQHSRGIPYRTPISRPPGYHRASGPAPLRYVTNGPAGAVVGRRWYERGGRWRPNRT